MASSNYRPKKETAVAFGLALGLPRDGFDEFLKTAGYVLSTSSIADLVIRFCVEREIYDLTDVNALLMEAGQKTLSKGVGEITRCLPAKCHETAFQASGGRRF
jgi:hypothetical protein